MKIKGEREDLKFKNVLKKEENNQKNHRNSKDRSRTFSGVVVGSVGSVHFRVVSLSGLYFSRSIDPFLRCRY